MIPTELNEYSLLRLEYMILCRPSMEETSSDRKCKEFLLTQDKTEEEDETEQFLSHILCHKSNDCCIYALEAWDCSLPNEPTKSALMICEISLFCHTFHQIPDAFFSFPMFPRIDWVELHYFFSLFSYEREKEQNQDNPESNEYTRNTFFVKKTKAIQKNWLLVKRLAARDSKDFVQETERCF